MSTLLPFAMPDAEGTTREGLAEAWWPNSQQPDLRGGLRLPGPRAQRRGMRWAVELLLDLGSIVEDGDRLVPTPLGHDLALVLVSMLEAGIMRT